jgi:translation initiation factor 2 subunit 1
LYDKFDHAYDAFKLALTEPETVFSKVTLSEKQREALLASITKKMAAKPVKMRTLFNLTCCTYEGIEAIRDTLLEAKRKTSDDKMQPVFQLIAPPEYKVEVVTLDKNGAIETLEKALKLIQTGIKERGGTFKLVKGPTRIGVRDDDVDNDDIIAGMKRKEEEDEDSSGVESNEEGIDFDMDEDDMQNEEEDDDAE